MKVFPSRLAVKIRATTFVASALHQPQRKRLI
jgi:hypothetical protein